MVTHGQNEVMGQRAWHDIEAHYMCVLSSLRKATESMSLLATTAHPCSSESMSKQAVGSLAMSSLGCLEKL